jgi:DNA-binding CsgD family transcriptional regulator
VAQASAHADQRRLPVMASFFGSAAAGRLCAAVAADPAAPILRVVVGPGGTGKTALLDKLAELYAAAGTPVCRDPFHLPADGEQTPVLVDDARGLPDEVLLRIRGLLAAGAARVIVAHRPGPRRPALDSLAAALGDGRPPIVLGSLSRTEVAARTELLCGSSTVGLVEYVHEQTGGMPRLVDVLVAALRDSGALPEAPPPGWAPARIPNAALEQFRVGLDMLDPVVLALLRALAVGATLEPAQLGDLLDCDLLSVEDAAERARATGLLTADGALIPLARTALLALTPPMRLQGLRQQLAAGALKRGGAMLPLARALAGVGATGEDIAAVLAAGALEAESPKVIVGLYAESVRAGAPLLSVAARLAYAAALSGDLDSALKLADSVVANAEAPDRELAVTVAATVLAQRGMLGRSAQLYRWFARNTGYSSPLAVPALLGTGDLAEAQAVLARSEDQGGRPPTVHAGVETLLAEGVLETVTGSPSAALSKLTRAAMLLEPNAGMTLMPDTPAALAAVVALNCGEFDVAESVLERAVTVGLGGEPAMSRYRLLQAWTAMQRGDLDRARSLVATPGPNGGPLEPREELLAAAIEVGLARREGDIGALLAAWQRARQAIVRHPVDLFALHSLGELAVAAARLKEEGWIGPHLAEAWALLSRLGEPPLWAAPMHWYAVQAAGLADRPADAAAHVAALEEAAPTYPQAAVLAAAARCWLRVMAGQVNQDEVETVARRLQAIGHGWDGSRLAGQAAVRTGDRAVMSALMSCARSLRPVPGQDAPVYEMPLGTPAALAPVTAPTPAPRQSSDAVGGGSQLSDREREVAALLITGLTYKEIGERLFISAKTVEHHVARMRQRFGSGSRGELFSQLRSALDADA